MCRMPQVAQGRRDLLGCLSVIRCMAGTYEVTEHLRLRDRLAGAAV